MKQIALSIALAAGMFGAVLAVAGPAPADAGYRTDMIAEICNTDPRGCAGVAEEWWKQLKHATANGWSYVHECVGEGCNTEETEEFHEVYEAEVAEESGSMEEMKEITFTDKERRSMKDDKEQRTWVVVMLADFKSRGWSVRSTDWNAAKR